MGVVHMLVQTTKKDRFICDLNDSSSPAFDEKYYRMDFEYEVSYNGLILAV